MTNTLNRALGGTTAAAIAALTLGALAPATATSLAVEVTPIGSTATPTDRGADVQFDLTLRVRDVGPVSLSVLPLQAADTTPVQHAVTAVCIPVSLPGVGTHEVTCEGSTASKRPLAPCEYDLTGQLLVTRDVDGHVLSDTYLVHRLAVSAPVTPEDPTPETDPAPADETPNADDESPEDSAPPAPTNPTPEQPDPAGAPPEESPADRNPGRPATPTPPVDAPADESQPTGTQSTVTQGSGNPGDTAPLTIDAGGAVESGTPDPLATDVPLHQPLLWTAPCIAAGIALLCALFKRQGTR